MFGFVRPVVLHPWVQDVQKRGTVQGNWVAGGPSSRECLWAIRHEARGRRRRSQGRTYPEWQDLARHETHGVGAEVQDTVSRHLAWTGG